MNLKVVSKTTKGRGFTAIFPVLKKCNVILPIFYRDFLTALPMMKPINGKILGLCIMRTLCFHEVCIICEVLWYLMRVSEVLIDCGQTGLFQERSSEAICYILV